MKCKEGGSRQPAVTSSTYGRSHGSGQFLPLFMYLSGLSFSKVGLQRGSRCGSLVHGRDASDLVPLHQTLAILEILAITADIGLYVT